MYCPTCGAQIPNDQKFCPSCGTSLSQTTATTSVAPDSPNINIMVNNAPNALPPQKSAEAAGLLCLFLGTLGIHDFYTGKISKGVVKILLDCTIVGILATAIWALIDAIFICIGSYKDKWNRPLVGDTTVTKILLILQIIFTVLNCVLVVSLISFSISFLTSLASVSSDLYNL